MSKLHTIVKVLAIILWIITIAVIAYTIHNHTFWNMIPIIAHNHIQNYLGWLVVLSVVFTAATPITGLFMKK